MQINLGSDCDYSLLILLNVISNQIYLLMQGVINMIREYEESTAGITLYDSRSDLSNFLYVLIKGKNI